MHRFYMGMGLRMAAEGAPLLIITNIYNLILIIDLPKLATEGVFLDLMDLVVESIPLSVPPKTVSSFHHVFWAIL